MEQTLKVTPEQLYAMEQSYREMLQRIKNQYQESSDKLERLSSLLVVEGMDILLQRQKQECMEAQQVFERMEKQILKLSQIADRYARTERKNVDGIRGN